MAVSVVCTCGKRLKAKDEAAGRTARCPACGNPVTFPESGNLPSLSIDLEDVASPSVGHPSSNLPPQLVEPPVPPPLPQKISESASVYQYEPWYYDFLEKYAKLGKVIGLIGFVFGMLLAVATAVLGFSQQPLFVFLTIFGSLVVFGLMLIFYLFVVALILLAVDIGRTLRAIHQSLSSKG